MSDYLALLKSKGLSVTTPRREVFMALYLYGLQTMHQLIERCPRSDKASVYRTVATLESIGVVVRVPIGFKYKVELSDSFLPHHHHITCTSCDKTRDIDQATLETLLQTVALNAGYNLTSHSLELHGLCEDCAKQT